MGPFLRAEGLVKSYGAIQALRGVDLKAHEGASLVLLGPNGAGKSTLLGVLAGRIRPTAGKVSMGGRGVEPGDASRASVGYLAHASLLYPGLTARENLLFYGKLYNLADPSFRAEEMLRFMGLWERRNDRVGGFSRGMEQRLSIARALLHDPSILLLDEPFSGLDHQSSRAFGEALGEMRDGRRILIIATHDLAAVARLGEVVVIMDRGRILHEGPAGRDVAELYGELLAGRRP